MTFDMCNHMDDIVMQAHSRDFKTVRQTPAEDNAFNFGYNVQSSLCGTLLGDQEQALREATRELTSLHTWSALPPRQHLPGGYLMGAFTGFHWHSPHQHRPRELTAGERDSVVAARCSMLWMPG